MTYGEIKSLVRALLIGDQTLTKNEDEILMLLAYAYDKIANESDAMKLFTEDVVENRILRIGPGRQFIRRPVLPEDDIDVLDIDDELCFVAARFMCSFVSREKTGLHMSEAYNLIRLYNAKVQSYFEHLAQEGELDEHTEGDVYGKREV